MSEEMYVYSVIQSCPILCDPMNCSVPGSSVHGIFQARILEWGSMPSSKGSFWLKNWTHVSCISSMDMWILYHWDTWETCLSSLSFARLFATPWTAAPQASLSITYCQSLLKIMSIESLIPFNHLILCCPLLLLPSIIPSIRVFSNESVLCIRWLKY